MEYKSCFLNNLAPSELSSPYESPTSFLLLASSSVLHTLHSSHPEFQNFPEDTRLFEISVIQYMLFLLEMTFSLFFH